MAGDESVAKWVVAKINEDQQFGSASSLGAGFLQVARKGIAPFTAAAIGLQDIITRDDVAPLFDIPTKRPEFVVNVPSKAIWTGGAVDLIHNKPAAFGTLGELIKASREEQPSTYRHREYNFFEEAFRQHTSVTGVTRLYDKIFQLQRSRGLRDIIVALVDAYDMSAEDIRNTRRTYGPFDVAVKISSYGSVTTAAQEAAETIGAEALKFGELMGRLNKK